jgi:hypothetical protein
MGAFDKLSTPVDQLQTGIRVKPGSYEFQITDITYMEFDENHERMPNQEAVIFELTVTAADDGLESEIGKKYSAFCRYPNEEEQGKEKAEMFGSILKQNMLQFGIPESKLETWDAENQDDVDAILGLVGTGRIAINKKNKDFDNLYNFELTEESGVSSLATDNATGQFNANAWSA